MHFLTPIKLIRKSPRLKIALSLFSLTLLVVVGVSLIGKPSVAEAACAPATSFGTDTMTVTVPSTGTYTSWIRMESPDGTNNQVMMSVDGGTCYTMAKTMAANTWTWVDTQSGSSTPLSLSLTAGTHTIVLTGNQAGVSVDSLLFTGDTSCNPNTNLAQCEPPVPVATPYYLAAGATANTTINGETWNADTLSPANSYVTGGQTNCQLPAGQTVANAGALEPIYACERWNDGSGLTYTIPVANGQYNVELLFAEINPAITAAGERVFNVSVNGISAASNLDLVKQAGQYAAYNVGVGLTVTNNVVTIVLANGSANAAKIAGIEILPSAPPTVSISAPTSGTTVSGPVTLSAAASDSLGIKSVQFYENGTAVGSADTASPYSTSWNSTTMNDGTYSITAVATNVNNISTTSAPVSVTVANHVCSVAPSAPTNVTDTATANSVTLNWTGVTPPTNCSLSGYNIYRGTSTTNLTKIAGPITNTSSNATYTDSTVAAGTAYFYQVTAIDSSGSSPESAKAPTAPLSVTTAKNCTSNSSTLPTTPTLTATSNTNYTSIPLSWTASTVSNGCTLSGYHVYRGSTLIQTLTGTSFTDTGAGLTPANLASGTSYSYHVVAYDSGGNNSNSSATVTATTEADNKAPTTPTGLSGTSPNSASVSLNWAGSSDLPNPGAVGLAGYYIYRNDSATPLNATPVTTTTYTDSNVNPSTAYKYAVAAVDKNNNLSVETADVPVTTQAAPANCTSSSPAPSTPASLTSPSQTLNSINLSWSASTPGSGSSCTITGYQVVNTTTGITTTVTGTTFSDTGLSPSKSYSYMVVAVESNGSKSATPASITKSTAADTQAPTPVTSFKATATSASQVSLSWIAGTDNVGITSYVITRTGGTGGTTTTTVTAPAITSVDNTVTASTSYSYSIVAFDAAGNPSTAATATVLTSAPTCSGNPSTPTGLTAGAVTATSVSLNWTASTPASGCSIKGYEVFNGSTDLTPNLVSTTSAPVTGLSPFTNYSFKVVAVDTSAHASSASSSLSVKTLTSTGCITSLAADVNHDCHVNFNDLAAFANDYPGFNGKAVTNGADGDINFDAAVNFNDLALFATDYPVENGQ
jgi:hypothetical protein